MSKKQTEQDKPPLYFIGPRSENRPFMAEAFGLIINDHAFWRRNYHPQDPAVIEYFELKNHSNTAFQEKLINELFKLMAELKFDPPFFSPRYMAHMISEPLMPGLLAYIATLLYNPNNVSSEASPVTLRYEREAGEQLIRMFGLDPLKSFAHLTGGGTVANYQSLYYNIQLRFLPLSLWLALNFKRSDPAEAGLPPSLWELLNIPYEKYPDLLKAYDQVCAKENISPDTLERFSMGALGLREMERLVARTFGEPLPPLKIVAPASSHYSWTRGVKLLGLGSNSLVKIKMNESFEMDSQELEAELDLLAKEEALVLQAVAVFGTTELGSFDPIDEIAALREKFLARGMYFPIHVDAAYGGYYSSLFQEDAPAKSVHARDALKRKHLALKECESITVDPHKLGYAPFGAGAFIFKHGALKEFVAENAQYCFNPKGGADQEQLGKYILEGSKPGAAAAAVYFNHKTIPLSYQGYGKVLENLANTGMSFWKKLNEFASPDYLVQALCPPQSNIVCFYIAPKSDLSVSSAHFHTSKLAEAFGIKEVKGIQEYDYIVSNTTIELERFKTPPATLKRLKKDAKSLCLVRMVFMNQWHSQEVKDDKDHLDLFLERLGQVLIELNAKYNSHRQKE